MYIPKLNLMTDEAEILAFMKKYSFATIVTAHNNIPNATHLPFTISKRDEKIVLTAHFAKANEQWTELSDNNSVLVIFTEPHAYISPKHYEKELNVPTWNYIAIHAYGQAKLIEDEESAWEALEKMIDVYDANYKKQWDKLPSDYKFRMLNGIVPFEITITELQAKKKLGQNRTEAEKQNIITAFEKGHDNEKQIAAYMKDVV